MPKKGDKKKGVKEGQPIVLPPISDPPPAKNKVKVTKVDIQKWLDKRELPFTKKNRDLAKAKIRKRKRRELLPKGRDISFNQTDAPYQIIYGEVIVGGIITFLNESSNRQRLHHIITLAGHQINSIESLYIDGNRVTFGSAISGTAQWANGGVKPDGSSIDYSNLVRIAFASGSTSQSAIADAVSELGGYWTSNHRQRGCAHAYLSIKWDGQKFGEGQPEISFKIKGKLVYDPRSETTVYSNNAALIIADFITDSRVGLGEDSSLIDWDAVEAAADICDEDVDLKEGGTEKRYTINCYFDHDEGKEEIIEEMVAAMSGHLFFADGKWKMLAGEYRTPLMALTQDDLRGVVNVESLAAKSENFNSIRGKYVSKENEYKVTEFPAIAPAAYITADNGRQVWADVDYPFTTSGTMAQRIANIALNRMRKRYRVSAAFALKTYELEPGDVVTLTLDRFGFDTVPFEIVEHDLVIDSNLGMYVELVLEETGADVYAWDEDNDQGNINVPTALTLPDPTIVNAITGLTLASGTDHLYIRQDGTVQSRIYVSWDESDDPFVLSGGRIEVRYRRSAVSGWQTLGYVSGADTEAYILDVLDGQNYDVRVRAENILGFQSGYTSVLNHLVVGKTAKPSDVTGVTVAVEESGLRIGWTGIADLDLAEYEIRYGGSNWATATSIAKVRGNNYLWEFPVAGTYTIRVRAIDTTGNVSNADGTASVTIVAPSAVIGLISQIIDNNVLLRWSEPVTHTLQIAEYQVLKGGTLNTAIEVGRVSGTFHSVFEIVSGTYTYWVRAIDRAGNVGAAKSIVGVISQPPDFVLRDSLEVTTWDDSYRLSEISDLVWLAPTFGETFQEHFENNLWDTVEDKAEAVEYWFQPAPSYAYAEAVLDLGAVTGGALVSLSYELETILGSVPSTTTISTSEDDVTYFDNVGSLQTYASNFRYVKIKIEIGQNPTTVSGQAMGALGLTYAGDEEWVDSSLFYALLSSVVVNVTARLVPDGGFVTVDSSDVGGTEVEFNVNFADIRGISVIAAGDSSRIANYDFTDVPNPTSFFIYLFDSDGDRISGDVSWTAAGVI
jgi:hypothetical protein